MTAGCRCVHRIRNESRRVKAHCAEVRWAHAYARRRADQGVPAGRHAYREAGCRAEGWVTARLARRLDETLPREADGTIVFTTGEHTVKGHAIERDPRVSICVEDDRPPFAFVRVDGVAELSEDPAELRLCATRIAERYMGAERAEEFGERNAAPGELVVRVRPTHTVGQAELAV